ncbi:MAG TPA: DUF192 domain-containing protein [Candidatus Omnitrophota bacterium]|nr:DUF192 domain-containing protein [Candidatus Omnitrophota bacterium]HPN88613.1 DUF192 domain-containing protein [Candidatus Omnitrophota bacterium]
MTIINQTQKTIIAQNVKIAQTLSSRIIGLLNRFSLDENEALVITQCQSIHMFFMKFAIDAIFVDKNNVVVGLVENIKPFQLSPIFFKANYVIEAPVQTILRTKTCLGDRIEII